MQKLLFIVGCLSFLTGFGQRVSSLPSFVRYGGGVHKKVFEIGEPVNAIMLYHTDTIATRVKVEFEKILPAEKAAFKKISLEDTALHQVFFVKSLYSLKLVRVPFNKNKLMRVLFDSLDFKIYDDFYSFSKAVDDVHYDELGFEYKNNYYKVVDFWTTSTKRKMIDVLNKIFSLNLRYKDFKGKEGLLQNILNFQNPAIASALSKNE